MEQLSFHQNLSHPALALANIHVEATERRVARRVESPIALNESRRFQEPVAQNASALPDQSAQGNVTEIIMPAGQVENMQLLLPMLTQLNQERRWLAWIDPPQALMHKWQQMHGIVAGELLVLRSSDQHDALTIAERALAAGTCHAVVMWTAGALGAPAFSKLQSASAVGNSHGVVLRQR